MPSGLKKLPHVIIISLVLLISHASRADERINVAAAANLSFALKEIGAAFEKESRITPVFSFGDTVSLTRQIEEGAPYDVFLSADAAHVDELTRLGKAFPDSVAVYARGYIVVAWNRRFIPRLLSIKDLTDPRIKRLAIANPLHAPYGVAAMEALKKSGVWDKIIDKLVYGENIRQTLQYIQTGDAQAGIVALSIADVPEVGYAPIEAALYSPIDQAACVIRTSGDELGARRFIDFLKGPAGKKILLKYGFGVE